MANNKILTYSFVDGFIDHLTDYIDQNYIQKGKDLNRLAVVFGGKRPALFLKRELARRMKKSFYPPKFFTIDQFIAYTVSKKEPFIQANDLDACYLLYQFAKEVTPEILSGRKSFSQFLPWTREILAFMNQLDLENIQPRALRNIKDNAEIGYSVPEDINMLLESIAALREVYHRHLLKEKVYSRGFQYLRAAQSVADVEFDEFDQILFCNFFYFNRSEEDVVKNLYDRDKATLIFQGDERRWPAFSNVSKHFAYPIREGEEPRTPKFNLKLHAGFDAHSQIGLVREILSKIKNLDRTVIVLPNADLIIPLLSEIASLVKDFNISMGYPLKRSSLYSLFEFIFKAQLSKREDGYYAKDYLKTLRHPFVKSLKLGPHPSVARVLVHKIEEILRGDEEAAISGSLFVQIDELVKSPELYDLCLETLKKMDIDIKRKELKSVFSEINRLLFTDWEEITNFHDFSLILEQFIQTFVDKSFLSQYPLNMKIADKILDIKEELKGASFNKESFPPEDIYKIFNNKIEHEIVAFIGSPLKGLQILGLFETRSLNFENVIMLDVNEGTLPRLRIYEPLIPREVMISLNLDRLELEEEIQRYQFMRLISSAQNVHLVYQETQDKERSRFVEELIWEEEKKAEEIDVVEITRPSFEVKVSPRSKAVKKTPEMIKFLKNRRYSASSLNTYLRSPLEFYYNYVLGLKEKDDLLDEPETKEVGTFIHELLEDTFKTFIGKKPTIDTKFRKYFSKILDRRFGDTFGRSMKSDSFLLKSVMDDRLNRFLDLEADGEQRPVKEVLFIEQRFENQIPLSCGKINFVYKVDRVDRMEDGSIMIIDYKTGSVDPMPKGIETIESMDLTWESIGNNVNSFQMPLYFYYLNQKYKKDSINAAFYNLRTLDLHKFVDAKMSYDRKRISKAFLRPLDFIMSEILNPEIDFAEN